MRSLGFFSLLVIGYISAQQIVNPAMQKMFPYADKALVNKLVTALNKENLAKQQTRLTNWGKKNEIKAGAKTDASNPLSKKGASTAMAKEFVKYRDAIKTLIKVQDTQFAKNDLISAKEYKALKQKFWALDKESGNDYEATVAKFFAAAPKLVPVAKLPQLQERIQLAHDIFDKKNPKQKDILNNFKFPQ